MNEVFRSLSQALTNMQTEEVGHIFSIARDIYVFPEAQCPFCLQTIKSKNRIWSAADATLFGWWDLELGKLIWCDGMENFYEDGMGYYTGVRGHPHSDNGEVCLGDTDHVGNALFGGWEPDNSFDSDRNHWRDWLERVWDHRCLLISEQPESNDDYYDDCECPNCRAWRGEL